MRDSLFNAPMRKYIAMSWSKGAAALLVAALSVSAVHADEPQAGADEAQHGLPAGFESRRQAIEDSLETNRTSWAGRYYQGDGRGVNIRLALTPDAGVVARWDGCLGMYGANHGALVAGADGVIRMSYVAPNDPKRFGDFPGALIPMSWGGRQYLIPPEDIPAFVSAINHGDEPRNDRYGEFLLREGDEEKPATGLPALPAGTAAQVRLEAVEASIATVELRQQKTHGDYCTSTYAVRLVPGSEAVPPLFVGERLDSIDRHETATVTALQGSAADAEISTYKHCAREVAPKIGERFTTGTYDEDEDSDEEE